MFKSLLFFFALSAAPAFGWVSPTASQRSSSALAMAVDLANGAMSFDHVCREWRCKYEGDKTDSKSLEAVAGVVKEYLDTIKSTAGPNVKVNRLVCGSCLDFKLMMTVPLEDFGTWEGKEFSPEKEVLEKWAAIDGISQIETQTITNMVI